MVMTDPIADMLTRIRNANQMRHEVVEMPASKMKREVLELLKLSVRKYNQTLIMITHDTSIALQADRVITIEDGTIKQDEVI